MVLCLDDYTLPGSDPPSLIKDSDLDAQLRNSASGINGHNRWFDKCVSYFVESSARAGGMGEHSPCDGLVVGHIMFDSLGESVDLKQFSAPTVSNNRGPVERLDWVADKQIKAWCMEAEKVAIAVCKDSDASLLCFNEFGTTWLKDTGTISLSPLKIRWMSLGYLPVLFFKPEFLRMLLSRWLCSWLGTEIKGSSQQHMKRLQLTCLFMDVQKS